MQIYNILFIRANIFIEKIGVGPDGRLDILSSDAWIWGYLRDQDLHYNPLGTFFQVLYLGAPIQAGIRAFINFGMWFGDLDWFFSIVFRQFKIVWFARFFPEGYLVGICYFWGFGVLGTDLMYGMFVYVLLRALARFVSEYKGIEEILEGYF